MKKFYDTSSLLLLEDSLFESHFVISSITLEELENIKSSGRKDEDTRLAARSLLHLLDENRDKYTVWVYNYSMLKPIEKKNLEINNDLKILATALDYERREAQAGGVLWGRDRPDPWFRGDEGCRCSCERAQRGRIEIGEDMCCTMPLPLYVQFTCSFRKGNIFPNA